MPEESVDLLVQDQVTLDAVFIKIDRSSRIVGVNIRVLNGRSKEAVVTD